ncbi:MAG: sensor histidine kinase [Tissierella sp.]|nr:sensor histidine kinase [Tissierella sp.]
MSKLWRLNHYLYIASRILIGIDIIRRPYSSTNELLFNFSLFVFIVVNDYLRMYHFYKVSKRYYQSMFATMIASSILIYHIRGYSDIFMFIIVYELILFTEGKLSKLFITLEMMFILSITMFININIQDILSISFWKENTVDLLMSSVGFLFYGFMLYAYRDLRKEKRKVDRLHKELELSYKKLQEQSEEIEQLSISKERNRLAGEIHDNLGHNLIALNMNLDVAAKIVDKDIDKAKDLINKAQSITKESIEDLRKAVYALKEERPITLRDSIDRLIDNIQSTGKIKVKLDFDDKVEDLLPEYKSMIHSSIKELITNSIKHGNSNLINIDIKYKDSKLIIRIKDNGTGCSQLIKGNGLLGIEDKIAKFDGRVNYDFGNKKGFEIDLIFYDEYKNINLTKT